MRCPNCDIEIETYCSKCGYMLNGNYIDNKKTIYDDNELMHMFVGNNDNKIIGKKENIFAGVFGSLYLIYRKYYIVGYIFLFADFITLYIFKKFDQRIVLFIYFIRFLFFYSYTNYIYLCFVKYKIKKIGHTNIALIRKKGGVSIISLFLSMLMIVAILSYIYYKGFK